MACKWEWYSDSAFDYNHGSYLQDSVNSAKLPSHGTSYESFKKNINTTLRTTHFKGTAWEQLEKK